MRGSRLHLVAQIRWVLSALPMPALPALACAQRTPLRPANQLRIEAPWALSAPPPAAADTVLTEPQPAKPANPNDSPAMRALILDVIKKNEADKKEADE